MPRKRLGETLVDAGVITNQQLMEALKDQRVFGGRLGTILLEKCYITEGAYLSTISTILGIPAVDIVGKTIPEKVMRSVPMEVAWNHMILPVEVKKEPSKVTLVLAMADPTDQNAVKEAQMVSKYRIEPALSMESVIRHVLMDYYQNNYGRGDYFMQKRVVPRCEDAGGKIIELSDSRTHDVQQWSFLASDPEAFKTQEQNQTMREQADELKSAMMEDMLLEKIGRLQIAINTLVRLLGKKGIIDPKEYMETMREIRAAELLKH